MTDTETAVSRETEDTPDSESRRTRRVRDPARLAALHRMHVLDTPPEEGLDSLAELARELLDVPVALVSLVDEDRQFFKSCLGLPEPWATARETPLSHSFCRHAVERESALVIPNAREHPLTAENPAIEELGVEAYLGIPLFTHDGQALGTLCAIDSEPREWSRDDVALMQLLAQAVIQRLELRASVTELEETQEKLRKREVYFRSLIEKGLSAVNVIDAEGVTRYASPNARDILGRGPEELIGESGFANIHPEELPRLREEFAWTAAEPGRSMRVEFRYMRPEGHEIRIEGIGTNRLDEPAVGGIVFNFRDVTEERHLAEALRQREKLDTVGELTAGIAHDFNNLLAVISASAELLEDGLRPDASDSREDLKDLRAAARGGTDLIRSLMTFSHRTGVQLQPTAIDTVVDRTARMLGRILSSSIRIECDVAPDVPPVHADPRSLEQILLNLATNARDAMPQGGTLTFRVRGDEGMGVLEVEDTGKGMDEATLSRAFEPFFTTKRSGEGTGLGLAMIDRLVRQQNGRCEVTSEPGRGTVVRIELPASTELPVQEQAGQEERDRATVESTILLVEDEEALRRIGIRVLEREGYTVLAARDGRAGLELYESRTDDIDLILSDQDMPGLTGIELLRRIRESGHSVPFVLTTGFARDELRNAAPDGEVMLLSKPWTLAELASTVRGALEQSFR